MKRIGLLIVMVVSSMFTFSCSDDDNNKEILTNDETEEIRYMMLSGVWRITNYSQNDVDMTSMYENYNFIFGTMNELLATNGQEANSGTWSVTVHNDENDGEMIKFGMNFESPQDFTLLRGSWSIIEKTDKLIRLKEVNENTNEITFEKN